MFRASLPAIIFFVFSSLTHAQNVSLDFDGTDDFIQTSYSGIQGTAARTVEAWIKTTANTDPNKGGKQIVVADYGTSATGGRFTLNVLFNYAPRIEIQGSGLTGTIAVNDGNWHHIAAVYDPSASLQYTLYVDGKKDTAGNIPTSINTGNANNFMIGKRIDNTNLFVGNIDEVRFYNVALSDSAINANYKREFCNPPSNLVAYYKLNEGNPGSNNTGKTRAWDYSGSSNHGTLLNFNLYGTYSNWSGGSGLNGGASSAQLQVYSCNPYTSPSGKYNWSFSGNYKDTLKNSNGCDSLLSIQLSIGRSSVTKNVVACDSFISHLGKVYYQSGTYVDSLRSHRGCDSIIRSVVTIQNSKFQSFHISGCDSVQIHANLTAYISGTYYDTLKTITGCDSFLTFIVEINRPEISYDTLHFCDSFIYGQLTYYQPTLITENYTSIKNCDSIVYTWMDVNYTQYSKVEHRNCDSILWNNLKIVRDTSIIDIQKTIHGCDSVISHNFIIDQSQFVRTFQYSCGALDWNGFVFEKDTTFLLYSKTTAGCDSVLEFNIRIIHIDTAIRMSNDTLWVSPGYDAYQWMNCITQLPVAGANHYFFPVTSNGEYAAIITEGDCKDTSRCIQTTIASSESAFRQHFQLFPIPSHGLIHVKSQLEPINGIEIYNATGHLIKEIVLPEPLTDSEIWLEETGIFMLIVKTQNGAYYLKAINLND